MKTSFWLAGQTATLLGINHVLVPKIMQLDWKWFVTTFALMLVVIGIVTELCAKADRYERHIRRELLLSISVGIVLLLLWPSDFPIYTIAIPGTAFYSTLIWRLQNIRTI